MPDALTTVGDLIDDDLVLVFDTETTGLPLWHQPSDDPGQPQVIELGAELCRADGTVIETYNQLINIGSPLPPEIIALTGITDAMLAERGIAPVDAWQNFQRLVGRASVVVGHNISFDTRMMRMMSVRLTGMKWDCPLPTFCTMWETAKVAHCAKPKLVDAVKIVLHEEFNEAHRALPDCTASRRIYFAIRDLADAPKDPKPPKVYDQAPGLQDGISQAPPEAMGSVLGHNAVPDFDLIKGEIDDLYAEAKVWLDGEPIATEGQAEDIAKLREKIQKAAKRAETMRVAEVDPLNKAKQEIQDRYNPLIQDKRGKCDLAIATLNSALAPYLRKKDDALRAEAAEKQRIANDQAAAALAASREAAQTANLEKREDAEAMLAEAKAALGDAKRADKAKSQVGGGSRAIGMKSVWSAELVDPSAALEHYRTVRPARIKDLLLQLAQEDVRGGIREIPGVKVTEDRVPA